MTDKETVARRRFVRFLLESPLLYGAGATLAARGAAAQDDLVLSGSLAWDELIKSAEQAVNVFDFEPVMRNAVGPGHYAYMAQGADDLGTIAANRRGYQEIQLRPRRLVDTTKLDMSVEIFGQRYASPILLCPVGAQQMFNYEGEVAVARAAKAKNALQVLSTVTASAVQPARSARLIMPWVISQLVVG